MTDFRSPESDYYQSELNEATPPVSQNTWSARNMPIGEKMPPRSDASSPTTAQGLPWVVSLFVFLLMLSFFLPYTIERMTYAVARGRERAEYETAGENLEDLKLSDLSKACQLVARRVGPSVVHIDVSPLSEDDLRAYPQPSFRRHPPTG